ncbi:hypothetical protein Zmor_016973 [Zophobas morio]|uniref:Uncharacterized protein n=1 Tax=Zophobas morio TaxID=2755281 RepID=A0AA38I885_9CUCU|nr:hypothetical protein Zmor_016973 [Zophobas morio]
MIMRYYIVFAFLATLSNCSIPPNFKRCFRKDPNFKKCYSEAAQFGTTQLTKAYEALGTPNLEPLHIPFLTVRDKGGVFSVDQIFKNCNLSGLTNLKFDQIELDLEKKSLIADGVIPKVEFKCQYELNGKVLLLPIKGEGDSNVTLINFHANYRTSYEEVVKNNKTYFKTVKSELDSSAQRWYFQFDNLFNGIKELGDNINLVMNDNWKEIADELQPEYNEIVRQILKGIFAKIWSKTSLEKFLD